MATALAGIRLTWQDNNEFEHGFRIYRGEEPFTIETLPEMLVELPPNTEEYLDTSAEEGKTYYYTVSTFYNGSETFILEPKMESTVFPPTLGAYYQGGYYVGNITIGGDDAGTYAVIVAPRSSQASLKWKTADTTTPLTTSSTDGKYNTLNMIAAGKANHPAAAHCVDYDGDGFLDWYLPSRNELMLFYTNRASLAQAQLTASNHWSSTEYDAYFAYCQHPTSSSQNNHFKTYSYLVRPVRRVRIS